MKELELKDVIHFYYGCRASVRDRDSGDQWTTTIDGTILDTLYAFGFVKPHLRRLEDMTEEEVCSLFNQMFVPSMAKEKIHQMSNSLYGLHQVISHYGDWSTLPTLFNLGFDLFNLIDRGLAIDQKTL